MLYFFTSGKRPPSPHAGTTEQAGLHECVPTEHDIFHGVHITEKLYILKGPGNSGPGNMIRLFALQRLIFKSNPALVRLVNSINAVKQGRFAGTVWADNGKDLTLSYLKTDCFQRLQATKGNRKIFNCKERHRESLLTRIIALNDYTRRSFMLVKSRQPFGAAGVT
jgi:hypothetical protein